MNNFKNSENSENPENSERRVNNRKRKKSVLKNARKYAKKGDYGQGRKISEDAYQYFVQILEVYNNGFSTEDEKHIFANNVLEQTKNNEINYSCNQIGCRVIEMLLPFANIQIINRFIEAFSADLRLYSSDRFASHVLQKILSICCKKSLTESDKEVKESCKQFTLKLSKFLLNNLEDFISDTYGNHIIREVFTALADIPLEKTVEGNNEIPEEYVEIIKEYANRLILWPHFKDFPFNVNTSGLLQVLLVALKKIDLKLLKKVVKKLIDESFSVLTEPESEDDKLNDVFKNKAAIMLLETSISVATPKLFTQIYAKCFSGHLAVLAKTKDTNFSVQKLVNFCSEKTEFEAMFDELSDHFEEILIHNYCGVIAAIAESCKRLSAKQGPFIQALMKSLHCLEPQERQNSIVRAVLRLLPFERLEIVEKERYFVNYHGSLLLQTMLHFNKPIKIVNSLLNMQVPDVKNICCDVKGSHVINAYMESKFVGERSREKFIYFLMGAYQDLARSQYGSRSLEVIWKAANLKQRIKIMEELSYKDGLWSCSEFGKIIATKLNLSLYKRNFDEWKQFIGKEDKTKELFAEIVDHKL